MGFFEDLIQDTIIPADANYSKNKIRKMYNIYAKAIAAAVRNNMEDFHCKYLSDEQMKELNPLIRNAIYTAMVRMTEKSEYFEFYMQYVPDYWEDCELITSN